MPCEANMDMKYMQVNVSKSVIRMTKRGVDIVKYMTYLWQMGERL